MSSGAAQLKLTVDGQTSIISAGVGELKTRMETRDFDLDDVAQKKMIRRIFFRMSGRAGLANFSVEILGRNSLNEPLTSLGLFPLDPATAIEPLEMRLTSYRFIRFRFVDDGVLSDWLLEGWEIWGQLTGRRL